MAAGIPTIGYNVPQSFDNIYGGKWGVVINDPSEINTVKLPTQKQIQKYRLSEYIEKDLPLFQEAVNVALRQDVDMYCYDLSYSVERLMRYQKERSSKVVVRL